VKFWRAQTRKVNASPATVLPETKRLLAFRTCRRRIRTRPGNASVSLIPSNCNTWLCAIELVRLRVRGLLSLELPAALYCVFARMRSWQCFSLIFSNLLILSEVIDRFSVSWRLEGGRSGLLSVWLYLAAGFRKTKRLAFWTCRWRISTQAANGKWEPKKLGAIPRNAIINRYLSTPFQNGAPWWCIPFLYTHLGGASPFYIRTLVVHPLFM